MGKKRQKKRGISAVVTTLLIILLAIVAVVIVWTVIKNLVSSGSEDVSIDGLVTDLEIEEARVRDDNSISVDVRRNPGGSKVEIVKIRFVFENETSSEITDKETNIKELEKKRFIFAVGEISVSNITKISISPIFKTRSGKEDIGKLTDSYTVRKAVSGMEVTCECDAWVDAGSCGEDVGSLTCSDTEIPQTRNCNPDACFSETRCVSSSSCTTESVCGNGILEDPEECDDGNTQDGDGCSSSCVIEFCGDGIVNNIDESCDDGNTQDGDGCSSTCQTETCDCTAWTNNVCGGGSCSSTEMEQTRSCSPSGCDIETQCVSDSSCTTSTGYWTTYQDTPHATVNPLPLPDGPKYYISPTGSDSNDGTSTSSPWKTFNYAIPKLNPGDTLVLMDGNYEPGTTGLPNNIDCSVNANNGTSGNVITIQAQNERKAFLKEDGLEYTVRLDYCSYWNVVGLHIENSNNVDASIAQGGGIRIDDSKNINIKRILSARPNTESNSHAISIVNSRFVLVEESEVYHKHRHGISLGYSRDVTLRRNYINGRQSPTDEGIAMYPASYTLVENTIIENDRGFEIHGNGDIFDGSPGTYHNQVLGSISMNSEYSAGTLDVRVTGEHPTGHIDSALHGTIFKNFLAVGNGSKGEIFMRTGTGQVGAGGILFDGITLYGRDNYPVIADNQRWPCQPEGDLTYQGKDHECAFTIKNSLIFDNNGAPSPVRINLNYFSPGGEYVWSVHHSNIFNSGDPGEDITDTSGNYQQNLEVQPTNLPSVPFYIPSDSNMKGAGENGEDIGANILYRYKDGVLTSEPLWDPDSGRFPCGAIVSGINDVPGDSCYDVHKRLDVYSNTLPSNYS